MSCEKEKELESFYTTKCVWPKWLGDAKNPQESLLQDEEIMSKFKDCYIRHNGLIEVLKNGN